METIPIFADGFEKIQFLVADIFWPVLVFVTGLVVGSFLNVCIARLPLEKSLLWPNSRCGNCLQSIHRWDNLPIIGYLRLRGRCRTCGVTFSSRYLWVELFTGLGFLAIFTVLVWPVGVLAFQWALRRSQSDGSLGHY